MFCIYELTPAPWGDYYRFIVACESEEDAKTVLKALESVNILEHYYKIVEWPNGNS